jgi:hypothetical protein
MPHRPLTRDGLAAKFRRLTSGIHGMDAERVLARLHGIEQVADVRALLD